MSCFLPPAPVLDAMMPGITECALGPSTVIEHAALELVEHAARQAVVIMRRNLDACAAWTLSLRIDTAARWEQTAEWNRRRDEGLSAPARAGDSDREVDIPRASFLTQTRGANL